MTSLTRELGAEQDVGEFATALVARLGEVYEREPVETAGWRTSLGLTNVARRTA